MLIGAARLASRNYYDLVPVWGGKSDEMNFNFEALFAVYPEVIHEVPEGVLEYIFDPSAPRNIIDFSEVEGRDIYIRGYHFVFSLSDINKVSSYPAIREKITEELRQEWRRMIPSSAVKKFITDSRYDLGVHIRRGVPWDPTDWSQPTDDVVDHYIREIVKLKDIKSAYVCTSSCVTRDRLYTVLGDLGVQATFSSANSWGQSEKDIVHAYVDMQNLSRCRHIFRHALSTFSALPAMIGADSEFIFSPLSGVIERVPLVFSGAAL